MFIEAPLSQAELEKIPSAVRYPLLVNMLTGGHTPILSVGERADLGYKIVVAPIESLLVTARAIEALGRALQDEGRVDRLPPDRMATFPEIKEILGVEQFLSLRERLAGR